MNVPICRHIRTNGIQCRAPKLHDGAYCFFHNRFNRRHTGFRHTEATRGYLVPGQHIQLTALEDRESVQVALSVVINALATGQLETKRATALLYGLQLASMNAVNLNFNPYAPKVVRSAELLPDGLDLAAPGATVNVTEDKVKAYDRDDDDDDDDDEDAEEDDEEELAEDVEIQSHTRLQPLPLRPPLHAPSPASVPIPPGVFQPNPELAANPSPSLPETSHPISLEPGRIDDIPCNSPTHREQTHG